MFIKILTECSFFDIYQFLFDFDLTNRNFLPNIALHLVLTALTKAELIYPIRKYLKLSKPTCYQNL